MANSPNPDYVPSMMRKDFGTEVLITNPKADIYLKSANKWNIRKSTKGSKVK